MGDWRSIGLVTAKLNLGPHTTSRRHRSKPFDVCLWWLSIRISFHNRITIERLRVEMVNGHISEDWEGRVRSEKWKDSFHPRGWKREKRAIHMETSSVGLALRLNSDIKKSLEISSFCDNEKNLNITWWLQFISHYRRLMVTRKRPQQMESRKISKGFWYCLQGELHTGRSLFNNWKKITDIL